MKNRPNHHFFLTPLFILTFFLVSFHPSSVDRLMMNMKSQSLHQGKVVNIEAELYYSSSSGVLLTRYTNPPGPIMITNEQGELVVYDEGKNTVSYSQSDEYSTLTNIVRFFLQGLTQDMGLEAFGFSLMETRFEDNLVITEWFPPQHLYGLFNRIKLVHEDFLPIYAAYYDAQKNLAKKVYYSNYKNVGDVFIPTSVTEFNYVANDSVVNRMIFSDIKTNYQARSPWFNFRVPDDALQN